MSNHNELINCWNSRNFAQYAMLYHSSRHAAGLLLIVYQIEDHDSDHCSLQKLAYDAIR